MNIDWSKAPEGATHYLPDSPEDYECWVKDGYSMLVGKQTTWRSDPSVSRDIRLGKALPRPEIRENKVKEMVERFALHNADNVDWKALFKQMYDCGVFK